MFFTTPETSISKGNHFFVSFVFFLFYCCVQPNTLVGPLLHATYPFFRFVCFQLTLKACAQLFLHLFSTFTGSLQRGEGFLKFLHPTHLSIFLSHLSHGRLQSSNYEVFLSLNLWTSRYETGLINNDVFLTMISIHTLPHWQYCTRTSLADFKYYY